MQRCTHRPPHACIFSCIACDNQNRKKNLQRAGLIFVSAIKVPLALILSMLLPAWVHRLHRTIPCRRVESPLVVQNCSFVVANWTEEGKVWRRVGWDWDGGGVVVCGTVMKADKDLLVDFLPKIQCNCKSIAVYECWRYAILSLSRLRQFCSQPTCVLKVINTSLDEIEPIFVLKSA